MTENPFLQARQEQSYQMQDQNFYPQPYQQTIPNVLKNSKDDKNEKSKKRVKRKKTKEKKHSHILC